MVRELSPELAKVAKDELNERANQLNDDIRNLKDWISKQPHLKARTDDQWLVAMLRGCKFSLERVKKKIDLYYTLRSTAPDITLRIRPTDSYFLEFFRLGCIVVLPKAQTLFPRVILLRPGAYDPAVNNVGDIMCVMYYLVQILIMEDDVASVLGTKILVDYEGVTMNHFIQANPLMLKKIVLVAQDSIPLRLRGSHHFNLPAGVEKIFTLISGFLNEKAKQRLKIHKSHSELEDHIPKHILPKEYGGDAGSLAGIIEKCAQDFDKYKDWMHQEEQLGTDEKKRIGPTVTIDTADIGSFRQLDID